MVPFSSLVSNQIRFLLQSLNESNSDAVLRQLCQFAEYGVDGSILLLQTCLNHVNLNGTDLSSMQFKHNILLPIFRHLLVRPNFSSVLCESLSVVLCEGFLAEFCNVLQFSVSEKVSIGLALASSENLDIRTNGQNFCMNQISELCENPSSVNSSEQIQNIILFLYQSDSLSKHVDSFMQMLLLMDPKEISSRVLTPLLSDNLYEANFSRNLDLFYGSREDEFDAILAEIENETSMADIMKELGYGCTLDISHCREVLSLFLPLSESTLSKIIGTIARTYTSLGDNQNSYSSFCSAIGSNTIVDSSCLSSWNIDVLIDSILQIAPQINWLRVMENLDHEGFYIPNWEAFSIFMSIYARACKDPFPLDAICGSVWKNVDGQISFLRYAVTAPPNIFTFSHSARQLGYVDVSNGHESSHGQTNNAWLSLDLLNLLCHLAERGHAGSVRPLLEFPLKHTPETLLLGISQVNTSYNILQWEVFSTVFPLVVENPMGSSMVLQLWHSNPKLVLRMLIDIIRVDEDKMFRVLEICQEIKILSEVLEQIPFYFSIRLASVASHREYLSLDKWLSDNFNSFRDLFFEECLRFLKDTSYGAANDVSENPVQHSSTIGNIYSDSSSTVLKILRVNSEQVTSAKLSEELKRVHGVTQHASSRMHTVGPPDLQTVDGFSDDVETEANSYFHQIFSCQLTIDSMIQMLANFKESSEKREKSIYECMIQNLFEEYRFFPRYPEKQLKIAAVLLGSLIRHQLVTHLTLGIALRGVLDALRKPSDSKIFTFGTKALEQFLDRLVEWPQYCNHILQISHLRSTHPDLVAFIERTLDRISSAHSDSNGVNSAMDAHVSYNATNMENVEMPDSSWPLLGSVSPHPGQQLPSSHHLQQRHQGFLGDRQKITSSIGIGKPVLPSVHSLSVSTGDFVSSQKLIASQSLPVGLSQSSSRVVPPNTLRHHSHSTGFGSALNIETLVAAAERSDTLIEAPSSDIQDKILFMINNISIANMEAKAKELTEILNEQYYPWFAQYMVMKRASLEPNNHDLYMKFLDKLNSKVMSKEIVKAAYENCKVLLRSELIKSSSEERSLLKNLGSWLGKFTIGKNQVLRAREIDPKSLIIEAYEKGLMIAVIPFTSKILEPCLSSLAYRPPNPWTMAILSLLVEIYALPNLKMNLKFDIEVLFKNLSVDLKEVKPTSLLKSRVREVEGNPDFSNKDIAASQPQMVSQEVNSAAIIPVLNQIDLQTDIINTSHPSGHLNVLAQYPVGRHLAPIQIADDGKLSERLLPGQGPSQVSQLQPSYSLSQTAAQNPNIGSQIILNQKLNPLGLHIQRLVPIAIERAVKEVMIPVVQRSVAIAIQTTKELVLKDYAMESDENRICIAAHLMVASLAGSLAHVTCKEPLRTSLSNNLRSSFQNLNVTNEVLEQAVPLVVNDNLDLSCASIEKAATEKAIQTIDGEIGQQLAIRRKHRDSVGSSYYDASIYTQGPMGVIPEVLRPRPGHLSHSQQRVYEDFIQFPWKNQPGKNSNVMPPNPSANGSVSAVVSRGYAPSAGQLNPSFISSGVGSNAVSVSQSLDINFEESNSAQLVSGSSVGIGVLDSVNAKINAAASIASTTVAREMNSLEVSNIVKELGGSPLPLPMVSAIDQLASVISEPLLSTSDVLEKCQKISLSILEIMVSKETGEGKIQGVISQIPEVILKCVNRDEAALAVAQRVFKSLFENASNNIHVSVHLAILAAIRDVSKLVVKEITTWVMYSDEGRKFNTDIIVGLICKDLLNLTDFNIHMAKLIDAGRNKAATEFAISLLKTLLIRDSKVSISELPNIVEALAKLTSIPGSSELLQLVEIARNPTANSAVPSRFTVGMDDKGRQSLDKKGSDRSVANKGDPSIAESARVEAGVRDQVSALFSEWYQIYEHHSTNDAACTHYISQLQQAGFLNADDTSDLFFRLLTELSVEHCLSSEGVVSGSLSLQLSQTSQNLSFLLIDVYAKLVVLIVRHFVTEQGPSKHNILPKILSTTVRVIQRDAEERRTHFNPRPYFRLFINWIYDLVSSDFVSDSAGFQVSVSFANAFHLLQPLKVPGFSFAWLELISHRRFMPKLLVVNSPKGWVYFQRLLVDLFKFMEPYLRNAELGDTIHFLYKATLRVLLVVLHDFPEFLCNYHFSFCDVIPSSCIQLRNVILSAFPRAMSLPDPSTPDLKIDLLSEMYQSPPILSEVDAALKAKQMKSDVDEYLQTKHKGSSFLSELKSRLMLPQNEAAQFGSRHNIPLINSLVLYIGMQRIQQQQAQNLSLSQQMEFNGPMELYSMGPALDIFQTLIVELDTEGRYLFLNAIANQLRYPNNHTHMFSYALLYLFIEAKQEIIQEQITRVLLERLIVSKPHPWGLLITFMELIKNSRYNFWSRSFTRCAPEIEKLFESVSRSCGRPKPVDEALMSGGFADGIH